MKEFSRLFNLLLVSIFSKFPPKSVDIERKMVIGKRHDKLHYTGKGKIANFDRSPADADLNLTNKFR